MVVPPRCRVHVSRDDWAARAKKDTARRLQLRCTVPSSTNLPGLLAALLLLARSPDAAAEEHPWVLSATAGRAKAFSPQQVTPGHTASLTGRYRFTPVWSAGLDLTYAGFPYVATYQWTKHREEWLSTYTLVGLARVDLAPRSAVHPWMRAGLGVTQLAPSMKDNCWYDPGPAAHAAAGVDVPISRAFALTSSVGAILAISLGGCNDMADGTSSAPRLSPGLVGQIGASWNP